uniref:Deoxyribose-phosphate aldolase n=1 Tax=Equus asinus TaxID=9793 RepID=A0A9L0JHG8_EQUAS
MAAHNLGTELDLSWISKVQVNHPAVLRRAQQVQARRTVKKEWQAAWLLKAVTFIDLTTLSGDDTSSNVQRLCYKAKYPIREDLLKALNMHDKDITTAAVCVYPARVCDAVRALKAAGCNIPVASVATGFPAGQTHLKTRLEEIRLAVEDGASEIDVVINRSLVLTGQWEALYDEIRQFRKACGEAHLKTILATGELGSLTNVYKASMIAMMAGSDFIKTSTGKETVNATFPVAIVMLRAIRDFFWKTGNKIGFKPAGGIRSAKDALAWLSLIKEELGDEWLKPELFRIGASTLLSDIERQARLAAVKQGRTAQAAQETKVCISRDTVETGQKGLTSVREAWENGKKHSGMLEGVIINSYESRQPTVCNTLCQNEKSVSQMASHCSCF